MSAVLRDGEASEVPVEECVEPAQVVEAERCIEDVCCSFAEAPSETISPMECEQRGGDEVAAGFCQSVCCADGDDAQISNAIACERSGGQVVPEQNCQKVCCKVGEEYIDTGIDDCKTAAVCLHQLLVRGDVCCAFQIMARLPTCRLSAVQSLVEM